MQSDVSPATDTAPASEFASDATGSAVAPSRPADPPITDEPPSAAPADGEAPVAVASQPTGAISVAASAPGVADTPSAGPLMEGTAGGLLAAGGSRSFAQQIDGWWLQLLNS
jgi:hypothetical protein